MNIPAPHHILGFPSLAAFIASDADKTTLIFRRFDRLAARNLLHLQARLACLERQIDGLDVENWKAGREAKNYLRNWDEFVNSAKHENNQKTRLNLYDELQETLEKYRNAMLLESKLADLGGPTRRTLDAFSTKLTMKSSSGEQYPLLGGSCSDLLLNKDDLVALRTQDQVDRLTKITQDHLAFMFQTGSKNGAVGYASDRRIHQFVSVVSVLIAASLLIGAIVGLYVVTEPGKRLVMIGIFTAVFAAGVGLLTNARRAELFAATAAYAAVLVVFVSGNLGACDCAPSSTAEQG